MQDQFSRETADVLAVLREDPGSGRRSIWLKWMSVGLVVILTLAAVRYWLFVPAEVATGFKTVPVSRQDLRVSITATGKLCSRQPGGRGKRIVWQDHQCQGRFQ